MSGARLAKLIRTRRYSDDGENEKWYQHHLNMLAMIAGFLGLGLLASAIG